MNQTHSYSTIMNAKDAKNEYGNQGIPVGR
jgi:hypothetical protein